MLTKNLVRYRTNGSTIAPEFIDPDDTDLLGVAEQLLEVFRESLGTTRSQLLEESKFVVEGSPCSSIIAQGLEKLLLDRTEFDTTVNEKLLQFRQALFTQTSQWLSNEPFADFADYQQRIQQEFQTVPKKLASKLYSDLPAHQPVVDFKPLSAQRLLHRYNCAQVQWLLLHCDKLELKISGGQTAKLRQLFKYLRFHQLLATIQKARATHDKASAARFKPRSRADTSRQADDYWITVDGPLNLFYQTKKYGLALATFFPAILHQQAWELQAEIRFKSQQGYRLWLDNSCGIQPYSHHFLAYIPEDVQLFQQLFQKRSSEWKITPASSFVPLEGEFYCFPDYTLVHNSGLEISMELFHPWHASHLTARLEHLDSQEDPVLILGVSKVLLKNPLVAQTIEASDYFSRYGFIFREMPTMDKVLPILEGVLGNED